MNLIKEVLTETYAEAVMKAADVVCSSGGRPLPCVVFHQGGRTVLSSAVSLNQLRDMVDEESICTMKKGSDLTDVTNRPYYSAHATAIAKYLQVNADSYTLGPLCLTFQSEITVYRPSGPSTAGIAIIRGGVKARITDGQHRYYGVTGGPGKNRVGALGEVESLREDGIGLNIVAESDSGRIRQDFADMARTKALTPSMLTAFDSRDPLNRVTKEICKRSPLLEGRVDFTGTTVGKGSRYITITNWILGMVLGRIAQVYFVSGSTRKTAVRENLATVEQQDKVIEEMLMLLRVMTECIPEIQEILNVSPQSDKAGVVIPVLRGKLILLTAVGFGISGMVSRMIAHACDGDAVRKEELVRALYTKVSWLRQPVDSVWIGGVIDSEGVIRSHRNEVKLSVGRILDRIGLSVVE